MQRKMPGRLYAILIIIVSIEASANHHQCEVSEVNIQAGGFRYNHSADYVVQQLTIENPSKQALRGSGYLIFDGLDERAQADGTHKIQLARAVEERAIRLHAMDQTGIFLGPQGKLSKLVRWRTEPDTRVKYKPKLLLCQ